MDLLIAIAYIVATTLLALWLARRQTGLNSYFVGDRNVSWGLVLVSIVATETSTVTFLSVPGLAFSAGGNLTFLQLVLGFAVGRLLVAWLLLPQYFQGELLSAYQVLRQKFNPVVQRCASSIFLGARTVGDGLRLLLSALLVQQVTRWDMATAILVMGSVTIFYTYLGGMKAVIWTDLIQFITYILGALVAAGFILANLQNGVADYFAVGAAADKFVMFDFSFDPIQPYTFWAGLIGGIFISMASHGSDQLMVQRYLCTRSLAAARAAVLLSGIVVFVQFALFLLIGIGLYALQEQGAFAYLANQEIQRDTVFGIFINDFLPVGVTGLVIAAVLAAAMSTLSSSLNSSAGAFVSDFYKPLRPNRDESHYLVVSRFMTLFWGLAQITVALVCLPLIRDQSIVNQVLAVTSLTTGLILGLFLLGRMQKPVRSAAALVGLLAGAAAALALWIPSTQGHTILAWPWLAPVGTLVTVGVALAVNQIVSLITSCTLR